MTNWDLESMINNVESFSARREVENGMSTGRFVVLAKLSSPRQIKRHHGKKMVWGDRVVVGTFEKENTASNHAITFNNMLRFVKAIEHVNEVLDGECEVNDTDYSFPHSTLGNTGVINSVDSY